MAVLKNPRLWDFPPVICWVFLDILLQTVDENIVTFLSVCYFISLRFHCSPVNQFNFIFLLSVSIFNFLHWLLSLINNVHEKIPRWLSRRNARVSPNQGKIAPSRACAWFENKRFDWVWVSLIIDQSECLVCFLFLHWINSFLHCFWKKWHCS